jgi:hypothetical protein
MGGLSARAPAWPHAGAAGFYLAVAIAWTFPLATVLATHVPGLPGDNLAFLWNFWWMRAAREAGVGFFETSALFAPHGVDLVLHTHTALPAFLGATAFSMLPLPAALNVTLIAGVALGGFCSYWLAWRITGDRPAALLAGLVFGCSPFVAARLLGHFNLVHAWTIPLFAVAATEYATTRDRRWALAAGLTAGMTAYIDYYFVLYQFVLLAVVWMWEARDWTIAKGRLPRQAARAVHWALAAAFLAFAAGAAIALTGGAGLGFAGFSVSARGTFNPLQAGWLLLTGAGVLVAGARIHSSARRHGGVRGVAEAVLLVGGSFALVASPLLWRGLRMALRGDYVSQPVLWRTSPAGIDAATLLAGHPFHGLWGDAVAAQLASRGISVMESSAWLGLVPLALMIVAARRCAGFAAARRWMVAGAVFLVWSLGPHLVVFGQNVGLILPHALLRYLPVVSNARMPGRAIVVVYLALAVLSAIAIAHTRMPKARRHWLVAVLGAIVLLDYAVAPLPLTALETPAVYRTLAGQTAPGSVLELPLGIRDGFGKLGALDERVLWYQTLHGRPLAGGFVARLPVATREAYETDPLFAALLALSAGRTITSLPAAEAVGPLLRQRGIAFVVLDEAAAPSALRTWLASIPGLRPVETDAGRSLMAVSER